MPQMTVESLTAKRNVGYGPQPIPVERDREIEEFLRNALTEGSIAGLRTLLERQHEQTLRAFAERMATLALRENSIARIEVGLVALCLGGLERGARDALVVMPLLLDATNRIGEPIEHVLLAAVERLGDSAKEPVAAFLARQDADRSLSAMGFALSSDTDGPRYVRFW